ncbi:MAG: AAA family ATPase [Solirubrobacterales bacterium]|nr:AAA family ATPase [Solirubrobacterales bacterium]MBV9942131.1 AAA family ATPase [Solirubrobacterales bacterium]
MYLRSIVLKGFKSFPDRTRLEFGPGVSVIVGPNGSGKSNITDAVLWALGEQSPLAVRGQSMQDVIFGGAPGRQGARGAEVELVLDDSEGMLGLGAPEVSILRRFDRAGEGEYRLAGARCRLVDVIEVLSDTGLGKEMHSVISQGRVESIVTSKPRDRRMLIEEAAGLGKHRKRRRRAQLKLARTQDNLDRALDVEREARSRLRPLKRQAEAAELHARLERQTLEARWELVRDDLRIHELELTSAQASAAEARGRRQELERALATVAARREAAEEALARRSAHREELSRRCFLAQGAAERVGYRADAVRAAAGELEQRLGRAEQHLVTIQRAVEAEPADPGLEERIVELEQALARLERDREAELARQLAELEEQLVAAGAATAEQATAVETSRAAREQAREALERLRGELREAERGVEAARREAARVGGELAACNQFLRSQAAAPGGAVVLADQLEVDPGYEHAVAAALDGRLRAAVLDDRSEAAELLDRAGADGARALVRDPAEVDAARALVRDPAEVHATQPQSSPAAGAEPLADHVRGPAQTVAVARRLLRNTWVVEDLDGLPQPFTGVAVTRAGRVWSAAPRELRQAAAVGEERVLAERNRRETLIRASQAAAGAEVGAKQALERLAESVSEAEAAAARAGDAHRGAVNQRDEAAEHERRLEAMIGRRRAAPDDGPDAARRMQLAAELAAARAERDRAARERSERQARLERLRAATERDRALHPLVRRVQRALVQAGSALAARREQFEQALRADRQAGEDVAAELKECAQEEATLHGRLHQAGERLTESEVRLQRVRDRAGDCAHELDELARRLELEAAPAETALAVHEREALRTRLERLGRRREQLGPVNPLAQAEYEEAVAHVEELERQREDLETALRELNKLIADTDRQIRESFEQMFEAAARNFEQVAARLFPGGRGRLRLMAERDGPARVLGGARVPADDNADPDDAEDGEQRTDAAEEPEEDLLGVEIEITPAGKDMKRLSLLSGGEKSMTALAFLFAVFLARPCPFYILDEVEAALDDLNIDRFLELLRTYSSQAQFIVVTHQKRTMEAADSLYGVSMGADGISKVISRRLPPAQEAA